MSQLPLGRRPHIVIAGFVNSGKSTLFNTLLGQNMSVVSPIAGTTTDVVSKSLELHGVGPILLIDTPGYGDTSELGSLRETKTVTALKEADIVLYLVANGASPDTTYIQKYTQAPILTFPSYATPKEVDELINHIGTILQKSNEDSQLTSGLLGNLVKSGDTVLLVMPQDSEAPAGRLIMPQVQTIRELLDRKCIVISIQPEQIEDTLTGLKKQPDLIITDSQKFKEIEQKLPKEVRLTSFSILMSGLKGDLKRLLEGAKALDRLNEHSKVLIAESCSHKPNNEDIGTVKIPRLLRNRYGVGLTITHVSGKDFPEDLSQYDLVIHCASCMFNRSNMLSRQNAASLQGIPMTNYGIAIAKLSGILSRVTLPE